jgi:hypothetical protein
MPSALPAATVSLSDQAYFETATKQCRSTGGARETRAVRQQQALQTATGVALTHSSCSCLAAALGCLLLPASACRSPALADTHRSIRSHTCVPDPVSCHRAGTCQAVPGCNPAGIIIMATLITASQTNTQRALVQPHPQHALSPLLAAAAVTPHAHACMRCCGDKAAGHDSTSLLGTSVSAADLQTHALRFP